MIPVQCDLRNPVTDTLEIGFEGENMATQVIFDCGCVFDVYPNAVPVLSVVNPDGVKYPAIVTREGNLVKWVVTAADLTMRGHGEVQLSFTEDEVVKKTYVIGTHIERSIVPDGEMPDPVEDWVNRANAVLVEIPQTIATSVEEALTEAKESGEFDGQDGYTPVKGVDYFDGKDGEDGKDGKDGEDGYTPVKGVDYFDGQDGQPGQDGQDGQDGSPGADGFSPTVQITAIPGGHRITVTDKTGPHSADIMDGLTPTVPVTDVQTDGVSILDDGVANIPIAGADNPGVVKIGSWYYGISLMSNGMLYVSTADPTVIKQGSVGYRGIAPQYQHEAVFYGLSKLAGVDLANETVTLGQYPSPALVAIQKMLGVYQAPWELIRTDTFTNATEADHEITVDQYGNAFELTDAILIFTTPQQSNASGKGDYGRIRFWYGTGSSSFKDAYFNQYTQAANAEQRTGISKITQNGGILEIMSRINTGRTNTSATVSMGGNILDGSVMSTPIQLISPPLIFSKITITAVTGTAKYWLYGKRKWN